MPAQADACADTTGRIAKHGSTRLAGVYLGRIGFGGRVLHQRLVLGK